MTALLIRNIKNTLSIKDWETDKEYEKRVALVYSTMKDHNIHPTHFVTIHYNKSRTLNEDTLNETYASFIKSLSKICCSRFAWQKYKPILLSVGAIESRPSPHFHSLIWKPEGVSEKVFCKMIETLVSNNSGFHGNKARHSTGKYTLDNQALYDKEFADFVRLYDYCLKGVSKRPETFICSGSTAAKLF